jgi:hypothetical protein
MYGSERDEGATFNAYAVRVGNDPFEAAAKELTLPAEFSLKTIEEFIDWNRSSPYKVAARESARSRVSCPPASSAREPDVCAR